MTNGRISPTRPWRRPSTDWLAPHLVGRSGLDAIGPDLLDEALRELLPWNLKRRLDAEAPTHVEVPTGSRIPVDYGNGEPVLAVRVQELFGLDRHPTLAAGGCRWCCISCRRPSGRSRSPGTCQDSGGAPGQPCARTCAASIPVTPGRRIPWPPSDAAGEAPRHVRAYRADRAPIGTRQDRGGPPSPGSRPSGCCRPGRGA